MEDIDETTGEVFTPAADGRTVRPAASTFGQFIGFLEDGQFDADLMPQRPDDDMEVLAGPKPSTDLAKWIENYVLAAGGGQME